MKANYNQSALKEDKDKKEPEKKSEEKKEKSKSGKFKIENYIPGEFELEIPAYKKISSFKIFPIDVEDIEAGSIEKFSLCQGAKLKCTQGDASSVFTVLPTKKVFIDGKPLAVISDTKPMVNVKPFGMCKSMANPTVAAATAANKGKLKKMPCVPNTVGMWSEGISHFTSDEMTPCNKSKCMCAFAGEISVQDVGHSIAGSSGGGSSSEEKEEKKKEEEKKEEFKEVKANIVLVTKGFKKVEEQVSTGNKEEKKVEKKEIEKNEDDSKEENSFKYTINHIPLDKENKSLPKDKEGNLIKRRTGTIKTMSSITIHSTGNPTSTAQGERNWLINPNNNRIASYHIVIDEKEAIEVIPLSEKALHSGSSLGNETSIGIEICHSGNREKTLSNAVILTANLLRKNNWTIKQVKRHYDWNKKNCPSILIDSKQRESNYQTWEWFLDEIKNKMEKK